MENVYSLTTAISYLEKSFCSSIIIQIKHDHFLNGMDSLIEII